MGQDTKSVEALGRKQMDARLRNEWIGIGETEYAVCRYLSAPLPGSTAHGSEKLQAMPKCGKGTAISVFVLLFDDTNTVGGKA